MRKMFTYCCGNRGHAPHLNRMEGLQLGSSRRAGPAPRAQPGSPSALGPDPGPDPGMLLTFNHCPCKSRIILFDARLTYGISQISFFPRFKILPCVNNYFWHWPFFLCRIFRSHSRRHSNRRYSRSRSRSYSQRKKSRSRSYSTEYRRKKSQSTSPVSSRRRNTGSRVSEVRQSGSTVSYLFSFNYVNFFLFCFEQTPEVGSFKMYSLLSYGFEWK